MVHHLLRTARRALAFARNEGGSVAVTSALALPVLLGIGGLAIEYADALVTRAETQRVADLAVHAAIMSYRDGSDAGAMRQAAWAVAELNGVAANTATVTLDADAAAGPVVRVTITTPRPIVLAQIISASHSVDVTVRAAARLEQEEPACVQALDPAGPGITISGGTSITTVGCAVSSNARVTATDSSRIVTETLTYDSNTAPTFGGGSSLVAPDGGAARIIRSTGADPLAEHDGVALARSRLAMVATMPTPVLPAIASGPNIDFGWNVQTTQQQAIAVGCTASFVGSTWTFACPSGGTINLGNLTIGGGLSLNFGMSGTGNTTYVFSGSIQNAGNTMNFGRGNYDIALGILTGGGTTTTFGSGTFRIGRTVIPCSGASGYSICNTSTLTFEGPSVFELQGGVRNASGSTLFLGTGVGNSFYIGPATNGDALTLDGGSRTTLGEATGPGDRFRVKGNFLTGGSSCLRIGAAANHDIAGNLQFSGGVILGSGLYAIDGYLHLGASWGGSVWCEGRNVSLQALGVTFALSGKGAQTPNQNCNGIAAFCAGAGYNSMQLVAPSTGPFARLAVLGPLTPGVTAGASFGGGASGSRISGAFYFPNGPVTLSGGAGATGTDTGCLQLIGTSVTMTGGTSVASECELSEALGFSFARIVE